MKFFIYGCGNMTQALLCPLKNELSEFEVFTYTPSKTRALELATRLGGEVLEKVATPPDNSTIFLGMKPQGFSEFSEGIQLNATHTVISILAGVSIPQIQKKLNGVTKILRLMPNTPCEIGEGVITAFTEDQTLRRQFGHLFGEVASVYWMEKEEHIEFSTPHTGSLPAFVFSLMKILTEDLKSRGIENTEEMILKSLLGPLLLRQTKDQSLEELIKQVTSKKGVTEELLKGLEEKQFGDGLRFGLDQAVKRSIELGLNS